MPVAQLKALAKESGKPLRALERYWAAAKKQAKGLREEGTPSFFRYVMGIVKRRAGIRESIAETLLIMADLDDLDSDLTPEQAEFADSIMTDEEAHYVHLSDLQDQLVAELGEEAKEDFTSLLTFGVMPTDVAAFIEFFARRSDMASRMCLRRLIDGSGSQTNQTTAGSVQF